MVKTCIHTVIKDELDEYLTAWLNHHSPMVDHIFIYEDIRSRSHKHITYKYPNVTLMSVLDIFEQDSTRAGIIKKKDEGGVTQGEYLVYGLLKIQALNEYDWCFTLDIDEFITLEEPYKSIPDVLSEFQQYDAVLLQWMNYGASGRIFKPDYAGKDYREFYTQRANYSRADSMFCINTKVVWNLNLMNRRTIGGIHCANGNNWVKTNFMNDRGCICYDKMYLKHYVTRSWEEFLWKLDTRGMHCGKRHRVYDDFFQINPDMENRKDELIEIKNNILKL